MKRLTDVNWVTHAVANLGGVDNAAEAMNVSRGTIYNWIGAKTLAHLDVETVARLARLAGVGIAELTGIEDVPELATHRPKLAHKSKPPKSQ